MDQPQNDPQPPRPGSRLRRAGFVILIAGLLAAGTVYWMGTRSPNLMDDASMVGFNRARERQMGLLYGKMGNLINDWADDLKQPENQAGLIVIGSILLAAGCFHFARLSDENAVD